MSALNQKAEIPASTPDLHFGNIAGFTAKRLAVPGVIVLVLNDDGTIGMTGNGVNHAKANEMLSIGIHLNLSQHYDLVRQGAAGAEAAEHIRELDNPLRHSEERPPHQARVIAEKADLDAKAKALSDFIGNSVIFPTLDASEQERLKGQNDVMWQYSEILGQRIAAFDEVAS